MLKMTIYEVYSWIVSVTIAGVHKKMSVMARVLLQYKWGLGQGASALGGRLHGGLYVHLGEALALITRPALCSADTS